MSDIIFTLNIACIAVICGLNFFGVFKAGGATSHNLHIFFFLISLYYLMLAPIVNVVARDFELYTIGWDGNVFIEDVIDFGFFLLTIYFLFYSLGYLTGFGCYSDGKFSVAEQYHQSRVGVICQSLVFPVFLVLYLVIFFNTLAGGINLISIFLGLYGEPTLGLKGYTYYLQNFADSLILLLVAAYYFGIDRNKLIIMIAMAVPLFLVLGFRYRLILSVFGIALIYIKNNGLKMRSVAKLGSLGLVFIVSLLVLTHNRYAIYMQDWDSVEISVSELPWDALVEQAKGSRIDFALYKAVQDGAIDHDLGVTMLGYPFVKLMPAVLFAGGEKPYPPPQLRDLHIALNSGDHIGEAVTSVGASFYAFGVFGVVVTSYLVGLIIAFLQRRQRDSHLQALTGIAVVLALFMWLTRGYTPGFLDHLAFMLAPVVILWIFSRAQSQMREVR